MRTIKYLRVVSSPREAVGKLYETKTVPDHVAVQLIASGHAEPVIHQPPVIQAEPKKTKTRHKKIGARS